MDRDAVQYIYSNSHLLLENRDAVQYVYTGTKELFYVSVVVRTFVAGKHPGGTVDAIGLH